MIKIKELYSSKNDCCGCELCSLVCSQNVIIMKPDNEGFLYPTIDNEKKCINCKACIKKCPTKVSIRPYQNIKKGYGGHANDEIQIKNSSSGALSTNIGVQFIRSGGIVYGVRYSNNFHSAIYARADKIEGLNDFRTSKYFQSSKGHIYRYVKDDLNNLNKVLFVGLPCEVSALYNYLGKEYEGLYTISLICHGVTSPQAHSQFCRNIETEYNSQITNFSVRHKINGWKPYYIKAVFKNRKEYLAPFVSTNYEFAFKYLKRPSCSTCKFKLLNKEYGFKSDLIIGDFHNVKQSYSFYNIWGTSKFYTCTTKGDELINTLEDFSYQEIPIETSLNSAPILNKPTRKFLFHRLYSKLFCKYGLNIASNNFIVRFSYKYIEPLIKKAHYLLRRIQIRLFKRVLIGK